MYYQQLYQQQQAAAAAGQPAGGTPGQGERSLLYLSLSLQCVQTMA